MRDRFEATDSDSPVPILHDTTEFTYSRADVESIGIYMSRLLEG